MVWISGVIGSFDTKINIFNKLKTPETFSREEEQFELNSVIRTDERLTLGNGTKVIKGTLVDEKIVDRSELVLEKTDFYIHKERMKVPRISTFILTDNGLAIANNSESREMCFRIISQLLSNTDRFVRNVEFDIGALDKAYPNQWTGFFYDREEEVDKGRLWAKDGHMKDDKDFGTPYSESKKNDIGIFTNFFGGGKVKINVTKRGSVTIMRDVGTELFVSYLQKELVRYMIPSPRHLIKK